MNYLMMNELVLDRAESLALGSLSPVDDSR